MEEKTYLTVTALNKYIERKFKLDPYLGEVYIKGEISNFKPHGNNIYFSIKDENSVIRANWFGARSKDFKDGDIVLIKTKVDFYLKRGEVNLVVLDMKKDRIGELYQKFLELKEKLEKEGLFLPQYKKRIPSFSQNIAVVTAKTGAAVQDITRTIQRRFPIAKINIYSTLVQGENSVQDIVKNIKLADDGTNDVIILGRGGGSIEDLWSFNTEEVIRAIFNCTTPIVTGIGHETDTTLADFVSDRRASTPTAAAELVTPNIEDIKNRISFNYDKLTNTYKTRVLNSENNPYYKNYSKVFIDYNNRVELLEKELNKSLQIFVKDKQHELKASTEKFLNIDMLGRFKENFTNEINKLEANSPLNIMKKGYSVAFLGDKKITTVKEINAGDEISVQLVDGSLECKVNNISDKGVK